MSKRGRRRSSRRRKSSSSSKQSVSPYIFHKQNKSNSVSFKDDVYEKGETDSFLRENVPSASEDEEKYNSSPPKEKRFKPDHQLSSNQRSIYTKTTEDKERGLKIVTSVSVSDLEDSSPNITFQQLHQPLSESPTLSSTPVTNIMRINCSGSQVKLEIQEILQLNTSGTKTTFVFTNDQTDVSETSRREETWTPNNKADKNYRFTFGSSSNNREEVSGSNFRIWDDSSCCRCCVGHKQDKPSDCWSVNPPSCPPLLHITDQQNRKRFHHSMEAFWDIPPPQEFADARYNPLDDLALQLQSCGIRTQSPAHHRLEESSLEPSFDQFSESDTYEPMFMRSSLSTNRSSFTKDFISSQKRRSWIRNNSIATVQHRACPLAQKRRQTFPGTSEAVELMQDDLLLPYTESFSSLIMCSHPVQSEELGTSHHGNDEVPASGIDDDDSSKQSSHQGKPPWLSPFCLTSSEENAEDVLDVAGGRGHGDEDTRQDFQQSVCTDRDSQDTDVCDCKVDQAEVAESGFDQDGEFPNSEKLCQRAFSIQVIPPSCSGSEEQMLEVHPVKLENQEDSVSSPLSSSVTTPSVGALQQRFLQMDLKSSQSLQIDVTESEPAAEETGNICTCLPLTSEETKDLQQDAGRRGTEDRAASCPDAEIYAKEQLSKTYKADRHMVSRCSVDAKEHLRPVMHKEAESGSGSDHWAKRRKLFKDSKQWSSAGGSSVTSDLTEESVSEDTRSMDMTTRDNEDGGFYMETFHSSAWIYLGDHVDSGVIPPRLNTRSGAVSIRERTVRISKGAGEYPWGFRIQFSKPIVVTEVDTNGAAEEAGLMVGDFVLAVNGTDVTSIPHSEAADLARQGPDVLTLTIGSDIARAPNTPRPACRGYLHKRTQSGLIKGWRKRWFVLSHDSCLYYYRNKRDEGKRGALSGVKLEAAEVGQDLSLGKPFVFKCRPLSVNRVFFFCATSNQEMKRWLEAMERAVHPIAQNHVWVDVTRHNSSLPPLAMKNPECLGLLHKMDKNNVWAQHYCILKDGCLYLYSGIRATHAHGGIYLQGYTVREQPYGSKKSTIELKPPSDEFKTFHLCSENPNENKRWILAIKASVKKWLLLHQALQESMNRPPEETRM